MKSFAKSLLFFMPFKKFQKYTARINGLESLKGKQVTFDEYIAMHFFFEDIDALKEHVQAYRFVDKQVC